MVPRSVTVLAGCASCLFLAISGCICIDTVLTYGCSGQLLQDDGHTPAAGIAIGFQNYDVREIAPDEPVEDRVVFQSTNDTGAFSAGFAGASDGYCGLYNPNWEPAVPGVVEYVYVYVKRGEELLVLKVLVSPESQQDAEPGERHIDIGTIYLGDAGLSLTP